MTFILNVLHKDFTLLAADRLGIADGPVSLNNGSLTVNMPGRVAIDGMRKIRITDDGRGAIASAGQTDAHPYFERVAQAGSPQEAMRELRAHMESYFDWTQRDSLLQPGNFMEHHALFTLYDSEHAAFFSSLSLFSRFSTAFHLYGPRRLLHLGSGSNHFEKAVGLDNINDFIRRLDAGLELDDLLSWLDGAFQKVSNLDSGCGPTYDAVVATRAEPVFIDVRKGPDTVTFRSHPD